jgi:autotransporter-associated beta strand protein
VTAFHRYTSLLALALGLVLLGITQDARAVEWIGATDDVLLNANWVGDVLPTNAQEAAFNETGSHTPNVSADWNVRYIGMYDTTGAAYTFSGPGTIIIGTESSNGNIDSYISPGDLTFNNAAIVMQRASPVYAGSDPGGTGNVYINSATFQMGGGGNSGNPAMNAWAGDITIDPVVDFSISTVNRSLNLVPHAGRTITLAGGVADTPTLTNINANGDAGGRTILGNSTTWTGNINISNSDLEVNSNTSTGYSGDSTGGYTYTVGNTRTGAFVLTNNLTDVNEFFFIGGRTTSAAQIKNKSGDNTLSGILQADLGGHEYRIQSDGTAGGDILRISGTIQTPDAFDAPAGLGGDSNLTFQGAGPGSVTGNIIEKNANIWNVAKDGAGTWTLSGATIAYSGTTTVNEGTLAITGSGWSPNSAAITVKSGATLDVSGLSGGSYSLGFSQALKGAGTVVGSVVAGNTNTIAPGDSAGTLSISGGLSLGFGDTLQYELSNDPLGTNDKIALGGALTVGGTTTVNLTAVNGYLTSGSYRLIDYTGPAISDPNTVFSLSGLTGGRQVFSFSSVANQVNLDVAGSVGNLTWVGGISSNAWDVGTTVNWTGEADSHFYNGDLVTFSDSGSNSPDINVVGNVSPGSATFTNSSGHDYALIGGSIAVGADLNVNGSGNVTFANSDLTVGGNFSLNGAGKVTIANTGTLALPATIAINSGTLAYNRADDIEVANTFTGAGTIRKEGTNTVTATGSSPAFDGPIVVASGKLLVGAGSVDALGSGAGGTTVESGATLDINGTNLANEIVTIAGAGVDGLGALYDSQGLGNVSHVLGVVMSADATIGASDGSYMYINSQGAIPATFQGNGHNLAVIAVNRYEVNLIGVGNANVNNIDVSGGGYLFVGGDTTLGPTGALTLEDSSRLGLYASLSGVSPSTGVIDKPIVVADSANGGGIEVYRGVKSIESPITLNGNLDVTTVNGANGTTSTGTFNGKLTGPGSLAVHLASNATASRLGLVELTSDDNDYAGTTTIGGGGGLDGVDPANDRITLSVGSGGATGKLGAGDVIVDPTGNGNAALRFNRTGAYTVSNNISGFGNVEAVADGVVALTSANTYAGTTTVSAGTLLVNGSHTGGGTYTVDAGGTLGGTGSITSAAPQAVVVQEGGTLAPGASVGTLTVAGDVQLDGTLGIEVSGINIDLLSITGGLSLGANSVLDIQGDLATAVTHVIASYNPGTLVGTFADALDATMNGYNVVYGDTQITLDELDGDANHDGIVNIFDINLVSANWDPTGPVAAFAPGNINHDTAVNIFDINLISANWNHTATNGGPAHSQAVPEPSTIVMALLGAMGLAWRVRRSRADLIIDRA